MELWMWIIVVAMAIGSAMWGFVVGRSGDAKVVTDTKRSRDLETEVGALKNEFTTYREQVAGHFKTTADLVHQMTSSYKAVYEHLATGSQKLCAGEAMIQMDDAPRLETKSAPTGEAANAPTGASAASQSESRASSH